MTKPINYASLPYHMQEGMKRYIEDGIPPGDFLRLILENDFVHAAGHADEINEFCLLNYARFLYSQAPLGSWGSREAVRNWIAEKRLEKVRKEGER